MAQGLSDDSSGGVSRVMRRLPRSLVETLAAERIEGSALIRALGSIVEKDINNLLLLPVNQLDAKNDLSKHPILAASRQFTYRVFHHTKLLSKTTSVASLAKLMAEGLLDLMTVNSHRARI